MFSNVNNDSQLDLFFEEMITESTTSRTAVFNRYFSTEATRAQAAEEDGWVKTFVDTKRASSLEKRDSFVKFLLKPEKKAQFIELPPRTAIKVQLAEEPINNHYLAVKIVDDDSEYNGRDGFVDINGVAKYGNATQKESFKVKPSDIVTEGRTYETVEELQDDVIANMSKITIGLPEDMRLMIETFVESAITGDPIFVENATKYQNAITNYVGEIIGPIALKMQNFITGDWDLVEEELLEPFGLSVEDLEIFFPVAANNPLADSVLQSGEREILVSSKAGKGAAASLQSLSDILNKMETNQVKKVERKFKNEFDDLNLIRDNDMKRGPLMLGIKYGIIDEEQKDIILQMGKDKTKVMHSSLESVIEGVGAKLEKPDYNAGFHALTAVAKKVAKIINADDSFDLMVREVLSNSTMIQVQFRTQKRGDDLSIREFKVIYPPKFEKRILLDANKGYFATRISGKLGFSLK